MGRRPAPLASSAAVGRLGDHHLQVGENILGGGVVVGNFDETVGSAEKMAISDWDESPTTRRTYGHASKEIGAPLKSTSNVGIHIRASLNVLERHHCQRLVHAVAALRTVISRSDRVGRYIFSGWESR